MTVILEKGGRQTLSGLSKVKVCVGWDAVDHSGKIAPKKGLLGKLQNMVEEVAERAGTPDVDIDLSCLICDSNGKRINTVFFANKVDMGNGINLDKDDRTGNSSSGGDDETIHVDLSSVTSAVNKLDFWVDIYECIARSQHFGLIRNAFVRVVDETSNQEICRYNLSDDYKNKTAIFVCSVYKKDGEWKFKAEGTATVDSGIRAIEKRY
jgi:tellurium resistance protein TerD